MKLDVIENGVNKLMVKLQSWGEQIIAQAPNIIIALLILFVFWSLSKWIYKFSQRSLEKTHLNKNLEHLLANILKITFICFGIVLALSVLELQKTVFSLLAGVGVLGLALGFAFQDLAANFVAGLILALRSPFKPGDVVKINDVQGSVVDIRLRDTLIRNFDGQDVFIPNKDFMSDEFSNYSSFGRRKIKIEVGVGYEDDHDEAVKVVLEAVKEIDGVLNDPAPSVFISELGGSSVNLTAHIWIKYPGGDYLLTQSTGLSKVKKKLESEGFNIPFPIRTLEAGASLSSLLTQSSVTNSKGTENLNKSSEKGIQ